jgi:hypothetical protein
MLFITTSDSGEPQETPSSRISVAHYSADEIINRFLELYSSMDFKAKVTELGISSLHIRRRGKALREFRAICIALWGLALQKSFPQEAQAFFEQFLVTAPFLAGKGKECARLQARVGIYVNLLADKKDTDFLPVAYYLAEVLALNAEDMRRLRLKISLLTRNLYTLIFDCLV